MGILFFTHVSESTRGARVRQPEVVKHHIEPFLQNSTITILDTVISETFRK